MAEEKKEIDLVTTKKAELGPLHKRMDIDKDLYFSKLYEMMRPDLPSTKMDNVINVTFNDATTFGMRAIATLGGAQRQTVVKGRNFPEGKAATIEEFTEDSSYNIDERLVSRGILSLDSFLNEQICIRGHLAGRCISRKVKKLIDGKEREVFLPDVLPMDSRFFVYEMGVDGMLWGAPFSWRSKASIESEYPETKDKVHGAGVDEGGAEVVDFYNSENNIIYIGGDQRKKQKNPFGYPPFITAQSAAGSMLADKDAYEHRGESIFWANRNLFPELNRTASIFQTLNVGSFAGAVMYESAAGTKAKKPKRPPFGLYNIVPVEKGMGFKPFPVNDIKAAARLFYAILYTRVQQGGLSAIDYGNLTFPLSAVAIARLTASRDQVFTPRIQAKAEFYQQLFKMIIKQFREAGIESKLGREGFLSEYKPADLEGEYQIKFRFFTESKEQEIANLSTAQAARGLLSEHYIRRNFLKVQDPEAEEEQMAVEQAERLDEVLFLYTRASKLIAQERYLEARILANKLVKILLARQLSGVEPPAPGPGAVEQKPGGGQVIPLVGQGKAGQTVAPEVGEETKALSQMERGEEATAAAGAEAKQEEIR